MATTLAGLYLALVELAGLYRETGSEPPWKRYADPELLVSRYPRSLEHGAYAVGLGRIAEMGERQREVARVSAEWVLRVSYQLSPTAEGGRTAEEALVYGYADRIRRHLMASGSTQGFVNSAGAHLLYGSTVLETPADGWIWLVLRGSTGPFYLEI